MKTKGWIPAAAVFFSWPSLFFLKASCTWLHTQHVVPYHFYETTRWLDGHGRRWSLHRKEVGENKIESGRLLRPHSLAVAAALLTSGAFWQRPHAWLFHPQRTQPSRIWLPRTNWTVTTVM